MAFLARMQKDRHAAALLALLLLALSLRLFNLGGMGLGIDEGLTESILRGGKFNEEYIITDYNPPLYYMIVSPLYNAGGIGAVRLFSVFASMLAIIISHRIFLHFIDRKTSLVATLLLSINPLFLFYSRHMRVYALFTLVTLAIVYMLIRLDLSRRRSYIALGALNIVLLYLHHYSVFVLLAELLYMIYYKKERKARIPYIIIMLAASAMAFIPWAHYVYNIGTSIRPDFFWTVPTQVNFPVHVNFFYLFYKLFTGINIGTLVDNGMLLLAVFPLAFLIFAYGVCRSFRENREMFEVVMIVSSTILASAAFSLLLRPVFFFRYYSFLVPFFSLVMAFALAPLGRPDHNVVGRHSGRRRGALRLALLLLLSAGWLALDVLYFQLTASDWGLLIAV